MVSPQEIELEAIKSELKSKFGIDFPEFKPQPEKPGAGKQEFKLAEYDLRDNYVRFDRVSGGNIAGMVEYVLLGDRDSQTLVGRREGSINPLISPEQRTLEYVKIEFIKGGIKTRYDSGGIHLQSYNQGERKVSNGSLSIEVEDISEPRVEQSVQLANASYGYYPQGGIDGKWMTLEINEGEREELLQAQLEAEEVGRRGSAVYSLAGGMHARGHGVLHNDSPTFERSEENLEEINLRMGLFGPSKGIVTKAGRIKGGDLEPYEYQMEEGLAVTTVQRFNRENNSISDYSFPTTIGFQNFCDKSAGTRAEWTSIREDYPVSFTQTPSVSG